MAIEQRYEQQYCPEHQSVHWVQVVGRTQIICHGLDKAAPTKDTSVSYSKHHMKGVDVKEKARKGPRKTSFRRDPIIQAIPEPNPDRQCVAEIGMPTPAGYASIKVFEDATAERFYEWFWKAGGKPQKINSVDMGTGHPLDLKGFVAFFNKRDQAHLVIHDRPAYTRLLEQAGRELAGSLL